MDRLEILVEEPSIAEVLRVILPKVLPVGWTLDVNCFVRYHEGKQDLQQSIPRKIRVACKKNITTGFIIVQDQDSNDCRALKAQLVSLCNAAQGNTPIPYKVRIVCHELEAWYLGDMDAIEKVFPRFHAIKYRGKKKFRQPDDCVNPKQELKKIVGDYGQIETARAIAAHIDIEGNLSRSFQCFISGLRQMVC
jgi:hypothetical protein